MEQFNEYYKGRSGLTLGIHKKIYSKQSPYQRVEVFETDAWGNLLTIDGLVMLSEKDEFVYHEMLSHVPLFTHPNPERILIIGGGDGGTAREVMRHSRVKSVDLVEIDETVVEACKRHLPAVGDFSNPKLSLRIEDGIQFIANSENETYDVVIVDGSDPVGPAEGLFDTSFVEQCARILKSDGVFASQSESPWVEKYHPSMQYLVKGLRQYFPIVNPYLCAIPLYPTGLWSMVVASKQYDPKGNQISEEIEKEGDDFLKGCTYYTEELHYSAFALPAFVRKIFKIE